VINPLCLSSDRLTLSSVQAKKEAEEKML